MNSRTHFRHPNGSIFSKFECQLACALITYIRTRRVDGHYTQGPTRDMLNEILQVARYSLWDDACRTGTPCNAMHPDARLNAWCLIHEMTRHVDHRYQRWIREVIENPDELIEMENNALN